MKNLIFFFIILLSSVQIYAQIAGNYQGQVIGANNNTLESTMSLQTNGANIKGQLIIVSNSANEVYVMNGQLENGIYVGYLTYNGNSGLNFRMAQERGIVKIFIMYQGTVFLTGQYQKGGNTNKSTNPSPSLTPKGSGELSRDPNLIGRWYQQKTNTRGGFNSDTYLSFYEDGTMEETTRTSMVSYGRDIDISSIGEFEPNKDIQSLMNQGYRWFTKSGKLCAKSSNGKSECNSSYHFEGNYLFIQWTSGAKSTGYTRSN
jgi:hypothetical protein